MLQFRNGGRLVESAGELPDLRGAKRLYLDTETTSGHPKLDSLNPWKNCQVAGISVTADDAPGSWYVPVRGNTLYRFMDPDVITRWAGDQMSSAGTWVNHNVKYDAHVLKHAGVEPAHPLVCTLTLSKIIDSDRLTKGGYGLDVLSRDWLEEDISQYDKRVRAYLQGRKSKDYGDVPVDILAEYACQDTITNRKLFEYIDRRCPEQCRQVWDTEIQLTSVLYDMEQEGLRVDRQELLKKQLVTLTAMLRIEEELHRLTDMALRPHVNADCYELLCIRHGLPIMGFTKGKDGQPTEDASFTADILKMYLRHPVVMEDPKLTRCVNLMLQYRELHTLNSLFLEKYLVLEVGGVLHPFYNQAVRTGRMSCKNPNAQQLFYEPKDLIHPPPGHAFLSYDYSQIEFRLIVHYLNNRAAIDAYAKDPDTDFHQWVAEMCGIKRSPAKNVNFCIGFGGGKKKVTSMLSVDMDLVGSLMARVDEMIARGEVRLDARNAAFNVLCRRRANDVYEEYHRALPELKPTSRQAESTAKSRGHIYNTHGRHRHLPADYAFRAFNNLNQSSAADIMKERTVATSPRFCPFMREHGIKQAASVHDETLFVAPVSESADPRVRAFIAREMETTRVSLRVPLRVNAGVSARSWADAGDKKNRFVIDRALAVA